MEEANYRTAHVPKTGNLISLRLQNRQTVLPHNLTYFNPAACSPCVFSFYVSKRNLFSKKPCLGSNREGRLSLACWRDVASVAGTAAEAGALPWTGSGQWCSRSTLRRGLLWQGDRRSLGLWHKEHSPGGALRQVTRSQRWPHPWPKMRDRRWREYLRGENS